MGLGALARGLRLRSEADLGDGVRGRRGARARTRRGGGGDLAADRRARRAHRPPSTSGELLAGRRDRSLRAVFGDVHRPRARVRRRRPAPGRRHRPLPRVLEPRLHDLRAPRGRLAHRPPAAQHRHRARARADGCDPAGRRLGLRYRRLHAPDRACRGALGPRVRLRCEGDPGDADHRRPLPRRGQPDRRRGRALERGSRLRAAADHATRDPAGPGAGAGAAVPGPLRRARDRAHGRRVPAPGGGAGEHRRAGSPTRRRASGARSTAAPSCWRS